MEAMNRIAQARIDSGWSAKELAGKLGVDTATLSNWENGRRQLSLERLLQIAGLLGVAVSYLLGQDEQIPHSEPVYKNKLYILHRMPVWTESLGWALVNALKQQLIFADGSVLSFDAIQEPVYITPPAFALELRGTGMPLSIDDILIQDRVWVEPITTDPDLAKELRGWYRPRDQKLVENEFGNRFYLDVYGAKWLAFESCFENQS